MKKCTQTQKKIYYTGCFIVLACLVVLFAGIGICIGSTKHSIYDILSVIFGNKENMTLYRIVWDIRMPRVCAAFFLGGALAVSGFLLQVFFANPIAGPFVLGISSGAKLTVAISMVFLLSKGIYMNSVFMILIAFIGSMISMLFVMLAAKRVQNVSVLVVCGVMIGYICSAICDFIVAFADDSDIVNLHNWALGSFSGMLWSHVRLISIIVSITFVCTFLLSKPMHAYQLGEAYAQNLGVRIRWFRIALIVLSGVLSSCVTAFAGPVSFVGIAVPHLMRVLFQTEKPIILLPACFLGGAGFCLLCDTIARCVFAPTELSISSVTAIFGAPILISILLKRKNRVR